MRVYKWRVPLTQNHLLFSLAVNAYCVCALVCVCVHTLTYRLIAVMFCPSVRSEHGIRYVKLPSASSASSVLRFLENMCQHLESDSLFSSQPFSPYSNNARFYNRAKSGGGNTCSNCKSEQLLFSFFLIKGNIQVFKLLAFPPKCITNIDGLIQCKVSTHLLLMSLLACH